MSGRSSRNRGADAERRVVNWLRDNGYPDARRYLAGDGRQPGDIDAIPGVCIEVKDRKASSWPSWMRQAIAEAGHQRLAVVVRRERGNPRVGEWEARWHIPDEKVTCSHDCKWWHTSTFAEFITSLQEEP